jgi:hypothetical protein
MSFNLQVFPEHMYLIVETLRQVHLQRFIYFLLRCSLKQNVLFTGRIPLWRGRQRPCRRSCAEASQRWHCSAGVVHINHFRTVCASPAQDDFITCFAPGFHGRCHRSSRCSANGEGAGVSTEKLSFLFTHSLFDSFLIFLQFHPGVQLSYMSSCICHYSLSLGLFDTQTLVQGSYHSDQGCA